MIRVCSCSSQPQTTVISTDRHPAQTVFVPMPHPRETQALLSQTTDRDTHMATRNTGMNVRVGGFGHGHERQKY